MAVADTAKMIAELSLKDKMSAAIKGAIKNVDNLDKHLGGVGRAASKAGRAMAVGVGAAAVGIGAMVAQGVDSLTTLESAVTAVDGAIKATGKTGQVTGAQVAAWANQIEASTQAAFDDKDITAATAGLLRYGKVSKSNLRPAMVVMTDLAAKTGDVGSASTILAKALADPAKAAGKLTRAGVVLTAGQQKHIAALVKAGKLEKAQAYLLEQIGKSTKGAAAAMNGPMKDAQQTLADTAEDAQRALARGFLPVLQRVAKWLNTELAKPEVLKGIEDLGNTLADVFDQGVSFVQKIPWSNVKSAMSAVAGMARGALDAFLAMPDWVKTAVIGGWGVNKLTGGALQDLIGAVGSVASGVVVSAFKSALGIQAAVVNINAGIVNGGGGLPGTPGVPGTPVPKGGGGFSVRGAVEGAIKVATGVAIAEAGAPTLGMESPNAQGFMNTMLPKLTGEQRATTKAINRVAGLLQPDSDRGPGAKLPGGVKQPDTDRVAKAVGDTHSEQIMTTRAVEAVKAKQAESISTFRAGERATYSAGRGVEGAIRNNRPIVNVDNKVYISGTSLSRSVTTTSRYGSGSSAHRNTGTKNAPV